KCVSGKVACVNRHAASLLKCYAKGQKQSAVVDAECLAKADAKLQACFAKREASENPLKPETLCRTASDESDLEALVHDLTVAGACAADPLACPTGSCAHSPCAVGAALDADCNPCVARVCSQSPYSSCCSATWDATCTDAAAALCGNACAVDHG